MVYNGNDRVVIGVTTDDAPYIVGIEQTTNGRWYINGAKLSNGTYVPIENKTVNGTYYYLEK